MIRMAMIGMAIPILMAGVSILVLAAAFVLLWLKLLTKQKEEQSRAARSAEALMQSSNLREKLISLVIHDLRSPLRFLSVVAGDLLDNQASYSADELRERIFLIRKGAQDVYNFSDDFLLWVTSQKDNFNITRRKIHLRPLMQEIHDFFSEQVRQKGNTLAWSADEGLTTWSDPHLLITIIRNLVDNANKYTDHGAIDLDAYEEQSELVISVKDTGRGMSPKQAAWFIQPVGLDHITSGSQLGHKFVFDLTQRLDGKVTIDTKEGKGTTIWLKFPLQTQP